MLIHIPDLKCRGNAVSEELENNILGGGILINKRGYYGYELVYTLTSGANYLIYSVLLMIAELAPLDLFLKCLVNEGDVLIIEEPESRLHPE